MEQSSGVSRSFQGHPRSFQGHLRSFLMIFHLLFTHTWVYKFNSLISQKSCKNDLVSEYVYISIYIYIFLNGILTFVHGCWNFFRNYFFNILTYRSCLYAQIGFSWQPLDSPNSSESGDIYFCMFILNTFRDNWEIMQ